MLVLVVLALLSPFCFSLGFRSSVSDSSSSATDLNPMSMALARKYVMVAVKEALDYRLADTILPGFGLLSKLSMKNNLGKKLLGFIEANSRSVANDIRESHELLMGRAVSQIHRSFAEMLSDKPFTPFFLVTVDDLLEKNRAIGEASAASDICRKYALKYLKYSALGILPPPGGDILTHFPDDVSELTSALRAQRPGCRVWAAGGREIAESEVWNAIGEDVGSVELMAKLYLNLIDPSLLAHHEIPL